MADNQVFFHIVFPIYETFLCLSLRLPDVSAKEDCSFYNSTFRVFFFVFFVKYPDYFDVVCLCASLSVVFIHLLFFFLRVHLLFCCFFLTTRWNQGSRLSFYTAIILSPGRDISHRRNAFLMACQSCQPPPTGKKLSQPKVVYSIDLRRTSKLDARQIIRKIKLFIYKVISSVTLSLNFFNRNQHT